MFPPVAEVDLLPLIEEVKYQIRVLSKGLDYGRHEESCILTGTAEDRVGFTRSSLLPPLFGRCKPFEKTGEDTSRAFRLLRMKETKQESTTQNGGVKIDVRRQISYLRLY